MTATLDANGLQIETQTDIIQALIGALQTAFGSNVRTELQSTFGQLLRIWAELEAHEQEALQAVYESFDINSAEGVALDRLVALLGMQRIPLLRSEVVGTATGTPLTNVPNDVRVQLDDDGTVWRTIDGPYVIGGGGTVQIRVRADDSGALAPGASTDWTILDLIVGFDAFESTGQPIVGRNVETDTELRQRAEIERYSRGQGPLRAVAGGVSAITGVTYVRVTENTTLAVDADGIPGKAFLAVVEGGDDQEIAQAIWNAKPFGAQAYGTDVVTVVVDEFGFSHTVGFDRVQEIDMWIRATVTTSTSEEDPPGDVEAAVTAALLDASAIFGVGDDVLPLRLAAALAEIPGIDAAQIELSFDDGFGDPYSTAKRVITIRQRAVFDAARIAVVEN